MHNLHKSKLSPTLADESKLLSSRYYLSNFKYLCLFMEKYCLAATSNYHVSEIAISRSVSVASCLPHCKYTYVARLSHSPVADTTSSERTKASFFSLSFIDLGNHPYLTVP
ncbi:hypothetical protein TNIN_428911 [Trichonephila inaurata madagascariensis]|uniref:Uncharacterized protein n=1 Tax=Trichonephila inaurata madagascariensis TaxID=2747483 RepID=A0A8X6IVE4_9ARAC|nr:hypothetical protein TNIN_428911 [Trichonephila inaurata madagascariensis]